MRGGIDGKEEIFSSKRRFGNHLLWRVKRRVQNHFVNGHVGVRVRFSTEVSPWALVVSGSGGRC